MQLPGVTEDIKWDTHLCFNIGGKMFIITSPDDTPVSASIKMTDEAFELLSAQPGFDPSSYLGRHKWLRIDDISRLDTRQWEKYLKEAYSLIGSKLPAKIRKEYGI